VVSGRRHHGRPRHLDNRVTRTGTRTLASHAPGRGTWREKHADKTTHLLFCHALKGERALYRGRQIGMFDTRGPRHEVYPCTYGDHHLITTAPRHWHVGRPA
jgi:hypothetical protein